MQGGEEDIEEHIMSLHTEMCESGEVTPVEEEHDADEQQKLWKKNLKAPNRGGTNFEILTRSARSLNTP